MKKLSFAALVAIAILQPNSSKSSGFLKEIVRKIEINPVTMCWKHEGAGTHYRGSFKKGDVVTATGRGKEPWDMTANGPRDFIVSQEPDNPLVFTVPRDGTYDISMGPCSEWGKPGKVSICLRKLATASENQANAEVLTDKMIRGRWGNASLSCADSMETESASFFYDGRRYVNEGHDCKVVESKNDGLALKLTMQCDLGNGRKYREQKIFINAQNGHVRKDGSRYKKCS